MVKRDKKEDVNMKKDNNAIVVTSIIAGVVLVVALVALFVVNGNSNMSNTVTVQGISTIKAMPDRVSVYFNIQTNGTTSKEASDRNSEIYNSLEIALLLKGFDRKEIGTENFNVYPNVYYDDGRQVTKGFIASRTVKLEFSSEDSTKLTSAVDAGINAGAGISYINFELSSDIQSEYKAKALEEASKDARIKADSVASGFGKRIGRLVSVSVDEYNYMPWVMYSGTGSLDMGAEARIAAENIRPTTQDITAIVSATYKFA